MTSDSRLPLTLCTLLAALSIAPALSAQTNTPPPATEPQDEAVMLSPFLVTAAESEDGYDDFETDLEIFPNGYLRFGYSW